VRNYRAKNALSRFLREEYQPKRKALVALSSLAPYFKTACRKKEKKFPDRDLQYRALWYVTVATGNRAENVHVAKKIIPQATGLYVEWGRRKKSMGGRHAHAWSCTPPSDVKRFLLRKEDGSPTWLMTGQISSLVIT